MSIKEKVAYLKGLAEGLGLDSEAKEGKLITVIIDTLDDIAEEIEALNENALDIGEELDAISDDLAEVEELLFDDDYNDDDFGDFDELDDDDDEDECGCGHCHGGSEDYAFEVSCPSCGSEIVLDEDDLSGDSIKCPSCGEELEFEFDEDDEAEEKE